MTSTAKITDTHIEIHVVKKDMTKLISFVSLEDNEVVHSSGWCCLSVGYIVESKRTKRLLHRLIAERMGIGDAERIDHINGNKLDNRRSNLRAVTHAENLQNRAKSNLNSKSGTRGVWWDSRRSKWVAEVNFSIDGKRKKKTRYCFTRDEAEDVVENLRSIFQTGSIEAYERTRRRR